MIISRPVDCSQVHMIKTVGAFLISSLRQVFEQALNFYACHEWDLSEDLPGA